MIRLPAVLSFLALCQWLPLASVAEIRAVATTSMIADMVREVAGEDATVYGMMGPGVDPHLYKATARDLRMLRRADVIFYNGLHLEGRLSEILGRMRGRGAPVYAVAEAVPEDRLLTPGGNTGAADAFDPHIWFDPELWALAVEPVVEGLSRADPAHAEAYRRRGDALQERYRGLAEWGRERVAVLPESRRILVTSHDAYNYFGRAFGFQVVGVQGISTVSEAGLADVTAMVDFIRENQIKAVFVESSVSPTAIERISEDSGAVVGGEIYSDAMGVPGEMRSANGERYDVGTYPGMFKHNVNTIVESLR